MKVFVYGTFKRGQYFHDCIKGSEFLGSAETSHDYSLFVDALPYLVKAPSDGSVSGELYEVDAETLKKMDDLDGAEHREIIEVMTDGNEVVRAWAYVYPNVFKTRPGIMKEYEWS